MIRVAVMGPRDLAERIAKEGARYELLTFDVCAYENERETVKLLTGEASRADIVLFTGPVPYRIARQADVCRKPMYYVAYSTGALYGILLSHIEKNGWVKGQSFRVSIDTLNETSVKMMLDELGAKQYSVFAYDGGEIATAKELAHFHESRYQSGGTDFAVTGLTSAYTSLREIGVPAYRLTVTNTAIHAALRLVELEAKSLLIRDGQLCVGIVHLLGFMDMKEKNRISEYEFRRVRLSFMNQFVDFCEDIKASMRIDDDSTFVLFTNRGAISAYLEGRARIPFLRGGAADSHCEACMGLGYGATSNAAERNAREALQEAVRAGGNQCLLMLEDGRILHVKDPESDGEENAVADEDRISRVARRSGVSAAGIQKLLRFDRTLTDGTFTVNEYAQYAKITLRSARRLLAKLESAGILIDVGREQPPLRGRPRRVFRLL